MSILLDTPALTVRELRDLLSKLPDTTLVFFDVDGCATPVTAAMNGHPDTWGLAQRDPAESRQPGLYLYSQIRDQSK